MKSNGWRTVPISELCEAIYDGPHATPKKIDSGPIFLGISNLVDGRLNLSNTNHLSEKDFVKWTKRVTPRADDIVFSYETRLGEAALIPEGLKCCLGRRMALMRPNLEKTDPRFLLYAYLGPDFQNTIRARTVYGSTVNRILLTEFPSYPITVPSLDEQKEIAHILGTLDDKIKLNRQMNHTLEGMARAIFKSWFIDFDPVYAKLDGHQPFGMNAKTSALFPNSFEESPLGKIPKGWKVRKLVEITTKIGSGATPRGGSKVYVDDGISLIRSQNVYDYEFRRHGLAHITEEIAKQLKNVVVKPDDILLNITGDSILRTCVVDPSVLPARVNQHVSIIRAMPGIPCRYLHLNLVNPQMKSLLLGFDTGATRKAVTKGQLEAVPILMPSDEVLYTFDKITQFWFRRIQSNLLESRTLSSIRETLLPKLLSGTIRVNEAEKVLEAVA
ncbi:MAG: restriction endonuclease subunit S [Cyanobacteria bacterium P01_A01_bin.37]